jgi:hypothetical protein
LGKYFKKEGDAMPSLMQKPFLKATCDSCKIGQYVETHDTGDWYLSCNECNALLFCYVPMPHQFEFHKDYHKYKMFAGGYG